jgi:hypothetical protein
VMETGRRSFRYVMLINVFMILYISTQEHDLL